MYSTYLAPLGSYPELDVSTTKYRRIHASYYCPLKCAAAYVHDISTVRYIRIYISNIYSGSS